MPFHSFLIFMPASEMFFSESKVFLYMECFSRIELFIFNFLLSRRDLHATGVLFPNQMMPDALYVLTLLKVGCAGLAFGFLHVRSRFLAGHVALSVSYALISFITAHSEIIMWLDAFIYLPLVILGFIVLWILNGRNFYLSVIYSCFIQFYMGFMIGVFSFLYFIARLLTNWSEYKNDCSLWYHFFTGRRRFNDHCIASSAGSSVKW